MDLVNREEFDVQTQVLLRTREKLAMMEQRLAALEENWQQAKHRRQKTLNKRVEHECKNGSLGFRFYCCLAR